jgi:hypothetical protein
MARAGDSAPVTDRDERDRRIRLAAQLLATGMLRAARQGRGPDDQPPRASAGAPPAGKGRRAGAHRPGTASRG